MLFERSEKVKRANEHEVCIVECDRCGVVTTRDDVEQARAVAQCHALAHQVKDAGQ